MIKFDFNTTVDKTFNNIYQNKKDEIFKSFKKQDMINWDDAAKVDLEKIKLLSKKIKKNSDLLLVIGIGGSYLGSKAIYDMFEHYFDQKFPVIYCGYSLSSNYLNDLFKLIKDKNITVNVISKSGSTFEIKLAYQLIKKFMQEKYSKEELQERIIVTTGTNGYLYEEAKENNFQLLHIDEKIGGRFSLMTDAHILPLSLNINIDNLIKGYNEAYTLKAEAFTYAATRRSLYDKNKVVENLVAFEPKYELFMEWLKQLFGESEGKDGKGILPTSTIYTRDLHSLGQFVQEGSKILFETFIIVRKNNKLIISGKDVNEINNKVIDAVRTAHFKGNVSVNFIEIDELTEYNIGQLIRFFFYAASFSALLFEVNPFDQPGVEVYKEEVRKKLEG